MMIDVGIALSKLESHFFDALDDIMEDTMIAVFLLHPQNSDEIVYAQALSNTYDCFFYTLPQRFYAQKEHNCKGIFLETTLSLAELDALQTPLFIPAHLLIDTAFAQALKETTSKGVILDATQNYRLPNFHEGITLNNLRKFSQEALESIDMTRIVLHSNYPDEDFESMHAAAKFLSDAIFRPEESIKNHATRNAVRLLGLR